MATYDNSKTGALFKNDRKESDKYPDYRGSINVNGVDHWISAWIKVSAKGDKFMSLSVSPKETSNYAPQKATQRAPAPRQAPSHDAARARQVAPSSGFDDMDEIPF